MCVVRSPLPSTLTSKERANRRRGPLSSAGDGSAHAPDRRRESQIRTCRRKALCGRLHASHSESATRQRQTYCCTYNGTYVDVWAYGNVARARDRPALRSRFGRDRSAPSGRRVARVGWTRAPYVYVDLAPPRPICAPAVAALNTVRRRREAEVQYLLSVPWQLMWAIYHATKHREPRLMAIGPPADIVNKIYKWVAGATRRWDRQVQGGPARIGGSHSISGGSLLGTPRWWARFAKLDALTEMRGAAFWGRSSRSYRRTAGPADWLPLHTYCLGASLRVRRRYRRAASALGRARRGWTPVSTICRADGASSNAVCGRRHSLCFLIDVVLRLPWTPGRAQWRCC